MIDHVPADTDHSLCVPQVCAGVPFPAAFVAVLGPPASGKSTVTGMLTDRLGAPVFRLREFADRCRDLPAAGELFTTTDHLGWYQDGTVSMLLRAAFVDGGFDVEAGGVVLLENLPGNARQLRHLGSVASTLQASLILVELTAPNGLLHARALQRRVCPTCEPDPRGDPHRPALSRADHPGQCARCDGMLVARRSDAPPWFTGRLARFRASIGDIRRAAAALGMPYRTVDTAAPASSVASAAEAACRSLLSHTRSAKVGPPR